MVSRGGFGCDGREGIATSSWCALRREKIRLSAAMAANYAANMEKATSKLWPGTILPPRGMEAAGGAHSGQKTIEDVAKYLGVSPKNKIKTLALMAERRTKRPARRSRVALSVLMRGDHQLNEAKLNGAVAVATASDGRRRDQSPVQISGRILGPVGD